MVKKFHLLVFLLIVSLAMIAVQGQAAPESGGRIVVVALSEPENLDAHKFTAAETGQILYNIYESLVGVNPEGEIIPRLSHSYEISFDQRVYTFYLRTDVLFHHGRPMVADDVKYSFQRILDPTKGHPQASAFQVIEEIQVLDDYTVRFYLKEPYALFLSNMAEVAGGGYIVPREYSQDLYRHPIGTGPFQFVHWLPNEEIKLTKNPNYWNQELPYLHEAIFKFIPDPTTALMNLLTGDVHVLPRIAAEFAQDILENPQVKLEVAPQNMVQLVILNHAREPLSQLKVRQALKYATNKEEIIQGVMWGYGYEISSHMSPVMDFYYYDLSHRYSYDPQRAQQLLAQAGYPQGFSMTLSLPAPYHPHVRAGEILANQWKKVGVHLELELVEWGVWLQRIYTDWDYDMTIIGFVGKLDPHTILRRYQSHFHRNMFSFHHEEYDSLIEKGLLVTEPQERREIYFRAQEILSEEAVAIYLQDPHLIVGLREGVEGWRSYPIYVVDLAHLYFSQKD